ncbi:TonB family protein [Aliiroseovarius sp.]|uniref:energy transducer TonB n=1 Tax=Aliiroseovarius sp. TaxID=1872442 RepID=UPI002631F87F|nr:TonB family protein [Aliiroseovarius sp.]
MSKIVQFSGLIGVSAALHVAAFWGAGSDGGAPSGAGGQNAVTLAAAPAELVQAVAQWDRAAEVVEAVSQALPPAVEDAPPVTEASAAALAQPPAPQPVPPAQQAALPIPTAPARPAQPEAAAPPPPQPAPEVPQLRPTRRPEAPAPRTTPPVELARPAPAPVPQTTAEPPARPAAKPAPASAPQPAARAAGNGEDAQAGGAAQSGAEAPSAARINKLMARWGGGIRKRVERRKRYPSGTRAAGQVDLSLSVTTRGQLAGVRITRSSGDAALDRAALKAVQGARLPAAPKGMPAGTHAFTLTLAFSR